MKKLVSLILVAVMLLPLTVYAVPGSELPFTDVQQNDWFYTAVLYNYRKRVLVGSSATTFSPEKEITRAVAVRALASIEGISDDGEVTELPFPDADPNAWYAYALNWAVEAGIVSGYSNGNFGVSDPVTREALACMFYNYLSYKGKIGNYTCDLTQYPDGEEVSDWAADEMAYVLAAGLILGNNKGEIMPSGISKRSQLAVLIYKLHFFFESSGGYVDGTPFAVPNTADADALVIEDKEARIVCWGDSLTYGYVPRNWPENITPYPATIEKITGVDTLNYGVPSDTSELIAMRQGALPVYVMPTTIPAGVEKVQITLVDDYGAEAEIGVYGYQGVNEVTIGGVKGKLEGVGTYYFTRSEAGEEVNITEPTRIITHAMEDRGSNDILVLFIGSNNFYTPADMPELFDIQRRMIEYSGCKDYIVVGFTAACMMPEIGTLNNMLREQYGDRFVDVREYLIGDALADHGITPTAADYADLAVGEIPYSLRSDNCHGNQLFYTIVGEMIAQRINDLGYLD